MAKYTQFWAMYETDRGDEYLTLITPEEAYKKAAQILQQVGRPLGYRKNYAAYEPMEDK